MLFVRRGLIVAITLIGGAWSCSPAGVMLPIEGGARVLFIGNSLTYGNDLPWTVAAIAASAGDTFQVEMAATGGVAFIDHLNGATNAVRLLQTGKWDFVVLQQGPTTVPLCRDSMVLWTKMFEPHIRAAGAEPALFMPWPIDAQWERMPLVVRSYQESARAVNGIFLPAGEAWRMVHEAYPGISLYGPDRFHPSEVGSFLAALTIYERLSRRDVRTIPLKAFIGSKEMVLPAEVIRQLQRGAHEANLLHSSTIFGSTGYPPASAASLVESQAC